MGHGLKVDKSVDEASDVLTRGGETPRAFGRIVCLLTAFTRAWSRLELPPHHAYGREHPNFLSQSQIIPHLRVTSSTQFHHRPSLALLLPLTLPPIPQAPV